MKPIFVIDWTLIPFFVGSLVTGLGLHFTGHGGHHGGRHAWMIGHLVSSLLFVAATLGHLYTHRAWYRARLRTGGTRRQHRQTLLLSFLWVVAVATGLAAWSLCGEGTGGFRRGGIGQWHYITGLAIGVLGSYHLLRRWSVLRKTLHR